MDSSGNLRDELTTTARQLRRMLDRGAISQRQYDELAAVIRAELFTLGQPASSPPQPASPSLPPAFVLAPRDEIVEAEIVEAPSRLPTPDARPPAAPPALAFSPTIVPPAAPHPLDRPYVPPPPKAPPRRPLAEVVQSFMEESNIRWMEIIAAVCIVISSVGLVWSLRNTLKEIPYFPALLFGGFTLAFHVAGLYTLRKWKLQAVSRVILVIALLLVPLSFAGAIVMSGSGESQRAATDPVFLVVLAAGLGVFGWVSYSGSRELVGRLAWPLAAGVLICSASQVLIHRSELTGLGWAGLSAIAAIPIAGYLVATVSALVLARRWPQLSRRRIQDILHVLGIATFALAAPLALLLARSNWAWPAVANLSPVLSLAGSAALALGLVIHRRTTARHLATYQTVGTAILVFAAILLLLLVAFAWPQPELLLAVGLVNAVILVLLGVVAGVPLLYLPAIACAALAATIGLHLAGGHLALHERLPMRIVQAALMGRTSLVLIALAAGTAGIAGWSLRRERREQALMLALGAGGLTAIAALITLFSGFVPIPGWTQDRDLAAFLLLVYAAALLAAGSLTKLPPLSAAGSLLLWTALVQALSVNSTLRAAIAASAWIAGRPVLVATVAHGVLTAAFAAMETLVRKKRPNSPDVTDVIDEPLAGSSAIALVAATPFILWVRGDFSTSAALAAAAALGWLLLAIAQRLPGAISAMQAMLALAPALFVAGLWKEQATGGERWWLAEEHLLAQLNLAALAAIVWSTLRRLTSDREPLRKLLAPPWPAVDQFLLGVATVALPIVVLRAALPHAGWELGFAADTQPPIDGSGLWGPLGRGWIALAVLLAALVVSLWERMTPPALLGLPIALYAAVWLGAAHFQSTAAVASAARWCAAGYAVAIAAAFVFRERLRRGLKSLPLLRWSRFPEDWASWLGALPLVLGGLTVLIITIVAVNQNATGVQLRGPAADSVFDRLGATASYAGPLLVLVTVLLAYAIRERQAAFALGGAAVFQLAVNLAFVLYAHTAPVPPAGILAVQCLQWNAVAAGLFALTWLVLAGWITPPTAAEFTRKISKLLWLVPVAVAAAGAMGLSLWAAFILWDQPGSPPLEIATLGHWLSYAAIGLVLAAAAGQFVASKTGWGGGELELGAALGDAAAWLAAMVVPILAATLHRFDAGGQWIAYHTLLAGWLTVSAAACGFVCLGRASFAAAWCRFAPQHFSAALIAALVAALTVRGNATDPGQPWWSLAGALGCCGIAIALGLARRSQPYAFASAVLAALGVLLFWWAPGSSPLISIVFDNAGFRVFGGWETLVLALLATAAFWLSREIDAQQRRDQSLDARPYMPRLHAAVACGLVPICLLIRLAYGLLIDSPQPLVPYDAAAGATAIALGGLLLASLWDRRAMWALPLLSLWGLAAWCLALGLARQWLPQPGPRVAALVLAVAAHLALSGQIWSYGANLAALAAKVGIPDPIGGLSRTARWLPIVNLLLVVIVCVADLALVLNLRAIEFRVASAFGPALAAWGVLCLAQERRQAPLQLAALMVAALSAVLLGWAELSGHVADVWMLRVFRLLMVLAAVTFAYGLLLPRFLLTSGAWHTATRRAGYLAGCGALAAFAATLVLEVSLFEPGRGAPVESPQVVAIAIVLVGLIAGLISLALLPGRDPLLLSARWKQAYVYAAEATAALLFAHLYLCRPLWFDTLLRPYWPFIVMGLAFLGVGAAEFFQRANIRVLSEPLVRTGSLLPLLPVLGWWAGSNVDYSLLLLVVGILYLALSFTQKSWAALVAAAVAGNGALWSLFHNQHVDFGEHPQLWLIPPALSVLAAAQVNRHKLPAEALTAIRYAATIVIYVSSTSEIMIRGLGTHLLPPMILLGLSVAGAFAGIALRVRAFLYLGTTFTLLALTSMVWHAAHSIDHNWPLWAFGICLGVGILVLLVLFEKNKAEMHELIARLHQWER